MPGAVGFAFARCGVEETEMSKSILSVGADVVVVEMRPFRVIYETKIARETKTLWHTASGEKYRKKDNGLSPQYVVSRFLMTPSDAVARSAK